MHSTFHPSVFAVLLLVLPLLGFCQPASVQYSASQLAGFRSPYQLDGDPASLGFLMNPTGLAVDRAGIIYVSTGRSRTGEFPVGYWGVRAIRPGGTAGTLFGCSTKQVDSSACGVRGLVSGYRLAIDSRDRLLLAHPLTKEILVFTESGPQVLATAPDQVQLHSLAAGASGVLFNVAPSQHRVWRVDSRGSFLEFAGAGVCGSAGDGGPAREALLCEPQSAASDAAGNLYIADTGNNLIRIVGAGGIISTFAGTRTSGVLRDTGPAREVKLNRPHSTAVDRLGRVFFAEEPLHRIRMVGLDGIVRTVAGIGVGGNSPDGLPALESALQDPSDLAAGGDGFIYFLEGNPTARRVRRFQVGGVLEAAAGGAIGDGGPARDAITVRPVGAALDSTGRLYVTEPGLGRIRTIDSLLQIDSLSRSGPPRIPILFDGPGPIAFGSDGTLYVSESLTDPAFGPYGRVSSVDPQGRVRVVAGRRPGASDPPLAVPEDIPAIEAVLHPITGLAVDPRGNLLLAEPFTNRIRLVSAGGLLTTFAGGGPPGSDAAAADAAAPEPRLSGPLAVAVNKAGDVIIADTNNHCLRIVEAGGSLRRFAGYCGSQQPPLIRPDNLPALETSLASPSQVSFGPDGSVLFVELNRIRSVGRDGIVRTIAGGGQDFKETLLRPGQLAVDRNGGIFLPDENRIFRLDPPPQVKVSKDQLCKTLSLICGQPLAPSLLVSAFGQGFTNQVSTAGITVRLRESSGEAHLARLLFADPGRLDFVVPDDLPVGSAVLEITGLSGLTAELLVEIRGIAPSLLTLDAGQPVPMGYWVLESRSGLSAAGSFSSCAGAPEVCRPSEVPRPAMGESLRLVLFGSGVRGAAQLYDFQAQSGPLPAFLVQLGSVRLGLVSITPHGELPGIDRIELAVPEAFPESGLLRLVLTADEFPPQPGSILVGDGLAWIQGRAASPKQTILSRKK
jgi:uncharacterized protein (TIGR03437 family)